MTFKPGDRVRAKPLKHYFMNCKVCSRKHWCDLHRPAGALVTKYSAPWVYLETPGRNGHCAEFSRNLELVSSQRSPQFDSVSYCNGDISKSLGNDNLCVEFDYKQKGENMKRVWEIIVINKDDEKVLLREIVIDGDEKSACSKISISFADRLRDILFKNLYYIAREIGQYEVKG